MRIAPRCTAPGAALLATVILAVAAPLAGAQIVEGTGEFEFYGGGYVFGPDVLTNEPIIGFRGGANVSELLNVQVDFAYLRAETTIEGEGNLRADLDHKVSFIDVAFAYHPRLHRRWVGMLFAGPGWAFVDSKVEVEGNVPEDEFIPDRLKEDSFFIDAGVGARGYLSRTWYVRPDVRLRWIEHRDADSIDYLITVALGYVLTH